MDASKGGTKRRRGRDDERRKTFLPSSGRAKGGGKAIPNEILKARDFHGEGSFFGHGPTSGEKLIMKYYWIRSGSSTLGELLRPI